MGKQQAWEKFTVLWRVPVRFVAKRQRWPSRRRRRFQRDAPTRDSCTTEDLSTSSLDSARREEDRSKGTRLQETLVQQKICQRRRWIRQEERKIVPKGRAYKRLLYNRRFVNVVVGFGKKRG